MFRIFGKAPPEANAPGMFGTAFPEEALIEIGIIRSNSQLLCVVYCVN